MFNYSGYNGYMQPQIPRYNNQMNFNAQMQQPNIQQQPIPNYNPQPVTIQGLQGKSVDSLDVVKAMDIPLDGSISYFPLVDGTAIVTKQLQQDGTSKTIIYRPNKDENQEKMGIQNYVTSDELNKIIEENNKIQKELKDEIKSLKRQIRNISDDIKDEKEE